MTSGPASSGSRRPVLHLVQCTNLGGMEQSALRAMTALAGHGVRFRLATPMPFGSGADAFRAFDPDMCDFPYRGRFGWRDIPAFRRHVRALAAGCDGIWITGTSAAALMAARGLSGPKVLSHHYHHFEGRLSWLKWRLFYELLCRDLDAVTFPTRFTRDEALRIAPWLSARAHVVRNGVALAYDGPDWHAARRAEARRRLGLPADAFIVGNAGWLIARKRFDVFLVTAQAIAARVPGTIFCICGGGPLEGELRARATALGLGDAVRFEGWQRDLTPWYRAWDVVLFNSDFDAFGLTPLEAAAQGCLVIASVRYGGLGEFIRDGESGFLFTEHRPQAMAERAALLYSSPDLRVRLREGAAAVIRRDYDIESVTRFYREMFGVHDEPTPVFRPADGTA